LGLLPADLTGKGGNAGTQSLAVTIRVLMDENISMYGYCPVIHNVAFEPFGNTDSPYV